MYTGYLSRLGTIVYFLFCFQGKENVQMCVNDDRCFTACLALVGSHFLAHDILLRVAIHTHLDRIVDCDFCLFVLMRSRAVVCLLSSTTLLELTERTINQYLVQNIVSQVGNSGRPLSIAAKNNSW